MNKALIILSLMFVVNVICSCDTCGPFDLRNRIESIDLITLEKNEESQLIVIGENPVKSSNLFFEVYLDLISKKNFVRTGFGFNSAVACSPAPPIILDRIASISIVSDNTFNDKNTGEDLGMYFRWSEYPEWDLIELSNLDNVTENSWFYLSLITPPDEAGIHQFTITIELEDERTFVLETGDISITP